MLHRIHRRRMSLEEVAQPFRQRQDPLAYRQRRKDMIDEMCSRLRHAPGIAERGIAERTEGAPFAGEGDREIVTAIPAAGTGEAVRKDTAFEVESDSRST